MSGGKDMKIRTKLEFVINETSLKSIVYRPTGLLSSPVAANRAKMMPAWELSPTAVITIFPLPSITRVPVPQHQVDTTRS